jgi:lipopolysaccharide exporter
LSYYLHPYRPKLSLAAATEFLHFSKWLVVQNMLFFLRERAPDFILGKVSGPHAVGIMNVSTEIASMPGTELIAPINRAALPGYSKLRDDPAALRREYLAVASLVTLVVTPVVAGIGVVASIVVALLLGPKWHEAAIIINLMAFLGITNVFLGTAHAPLLAMGRPSVFAKITAIQVSVLIPVLIIMSSRYGVVGAATGYILTALGLLPLNIALVLRTIEMRAATLLREVWRPILAAGTMYVVTKLVAMPVIDIATLSSSEALRLLAIYVPLGALVYVATLASLWMLSGRPEGAETIVMRIVAERLRHVHALLSRQ